MSNQTPYFHWEHKIPYDEYVMAIEISNQELLAGWSWDFKKGAWVKKKVGRFKLDMSMDIEQLTEYHYKWSRRASSKLDPKNMDPRSPK